MRDIIIESVKNYSKIYLSKEIEVVNKFDISHFKCAKVKIFGDMNFDVVLYIDEESLNNICNELFGFFDENLRTDLLKEIVNIIAGNIQTKLEKNLEISTPIVCDNCEIGEGIYFKNDKLKIVVSLKERITV